MSNKNNNEEVKIFACGTDQISAASTILQAPVSAISTLGNSLLSNFNDSTRYFLQYYQTARSNSEKEANSLKNEYYKDRCLTIMVFLGVVMIIKMCNKNAFNTLKKAINESECSYSEHVKLTKENAAATSISINTTENVSES